MIQNTASCNFAFEQSWRPKAAVCETTCGMSGLPSGITSKKPRQNRCAFARFLAYWKCGVVSLRPANDNWSTPLRFHYLSDLHLESQDAPDALPEGEVLIVAGDLCHARCLAAAADDGYAQVQRDRVLRFFERANRNFGKIIMVMGNHDHYDGVFEDSAAQFRRHLDGITVLDNEAITIGDVRLFGTTLWSDFEGGNADAMKRASKGCGEFFFVKKRVLDEAGAETLARFRPADALIAHQHALDALEIFIAEPAPGRKVVVSHHAPSRKGLNPLHQGNGLDGAYASTLDGLIERSGVSEWVHGHTHIRRIYRIGDTQMRVNCRGFADRDPGARQFRADTHFDI
jgi:Icc-related predicted phosphoesterase